MLEVAFVVVVVAVVVAFAAEVAALAVAGSGVKVRPGSSTAINCLNRKMFFFLRRRFFRDFFIFLNLLIAIVYLVFPFIYYGD